MNALIRWLYRCTLSCAMCFLIALTLYNRTNHATVKCHRRPVLICHSEDKHSISFGILIPSTTNYTNMCSILSIVPFYFKIYNGSYAVVSFY